jgi:hypothetical protein
MSVVTYDVSKRILTYADEETFFVSLLFLLILRKQFERSHRKGDIRRVIVPVDSIHIGHTSHGHPIAVPVGVHASSREHRLNGWLIDYAVG